MQVIIPANERVMTILKGIKRSGSCDRRICYCVENLTGDGILLYNTLTCEMVLLTQEEYADLAHNQYLKEHWFLVPEKANDREYADLVRWVLENRQKKNSDITGYTVFPTTDCNARCFYCFELGRSRIPMSPETAKKTAHYIKKHCGGKQVRISWFGGEPLYNREAIEIICTILRNEGVQFTSTAVSNGYLFDRETVRVAVEEWNLKKVQITLDGTEETYNRVKAFVYKGVNPYQTVLENMGHLLDAGVKISVRLNMDMNNAENLCSLVEELSQRFVGRTGLSVYAHHIFKGNEAIADSYTKDEWESLGQAMIRLEDVIRACGFARDNGLPRNIRMNHCMADSGRSVTILPDGDIGLCEHFSEDEFIGHLDREGFESKTVAAWRERQPEIPECASCFYYPGCVQLKKCPNGGKCYNQLQDERLRKMKRSMLKEYDKWKAQATSEEAEDDVVC